MKITFLLKACRKKKLMEVCWNFVKKLMKWCKKSFFRKRKKKRLCKSLAIHSSPIFFLLDHRCVSDLNQFSMELYCKRFIQTGIIHILQHSTLMQPLLVPNMSAWEVNSAETLSSLIIERLAKDYSKMYREIATNCVNMN